MSDPALSRRDFLGAAVTAAAFSGGVLGCASPGRAAPAGDPPEPHAAAAPVRTPASEKLNIAGIGIGGMGAGNLANLETENIVALCDVDPKNYAAKTIAKYPNAKVYTDYRKMLEQQKDIEAVLIATPDHTHAVIAMAALQAGKHVYLQKPLTHDVYETRKLMQAAKDHPRLATQMGIQGHSDEGCRLISEWLADGAIGDVTEVDVWCNDSYYPWSHAGWSPNGPERPKDAAPVPDGMDWDCWIGPAPMRAYHPGLHPMAWRAWWDFGSGWMADRGAHQIDPAYYALKLGPPTTIEATTLGQTDETHSIAGIVTFQFAARDKLPPVKLTWYEGMRAPRPEELDAGRKMGDGDGGALFKGTKGKIICGTYGNSPRIIPEKKMQAYKRPEKTIPRVEGSHEQDWVRACKAGKTGGANFVYSGPLTEICLLGVIAKRMDARIAWDAAKMRITSVDKPDAKPEDLAFANRMLKREYRSGWSL
jgi:predicted dehydrogenase